MDSDSSSLMNSDDDLLQNDLIYRKDNDPMEGGDRATQDAKAEGNKPA